MANSLKSKTTVLISYNPISGFSSGWHARKRIFVCASDTGFGQDVGNGKDNYSRAGSVMHRISGQFYRGSVPTERIKRYYVYAGLAAMRQAINMAKSLRSESQAPVTVVACDCNAREKRDLLEGTGIDIMWCECGGHKTLGRIAEAAIMG